MNFSGRRFDGVDFIWLQSPPWHGVWTRQNHFARRLARAGARILYVENPPALRSRLKTERRTASPVEVEPGITVMKLPLQIPGGQKSSLLGRLNGRRFAAAIRAQAARMGMTDPIIWCRLPHAVHALEHLPGGAVIYDVTDDYDYYARTDTARRLSRQLETRLAARADQIFTTTGQLRDKLRSLTAAPVTQVPNGVDAIFFQPPDVDPIPDVPRPRIGFVGLVAAWMDFDLLERVARTWPGQVVVVGPVQPEVASRFHAIPGIVSVGAVPHMSVPAYLGAFDVCILPHQTSELRHRSDPLKIVEYLAAGRPVVSVALRPVEPMRPLVDVAATSDEFVALIAERLADPRPDLVQPRRAMAAGRDWDSLFEAVALRLEPLIDRKGADAGPALQGV